MLLLGIDIGTSSIKVSVVDAQTQQCIASANYPDSENPVISLQHGWAEQSPDTWWQHVQQAILRVNAEKKYNPQDIAAIGIAYQMHGLVCTDVTQNVLRNSIIWCDSRAVELGENAFDAIGHERCLSHLLNSPGNFTAAKLAWVKANEPDVYEKINAIMLPGDFIAMKLTGNITTTIPALSEGIFWDFRSNSLSDDVFDYYGLSKKFIPSIHPVFAEHGRLTAAVASVLSLKPGTPITYKAGDQPNNAFSLNVLEPGEVAATAGTSGVIYAVSDELAYDGQSRVNTFAHVNYTVPSPVEQSSKTKIGSEVRKGEVRLGILLCVNGCGIMNRYIKDNFSNGLSYMQMNELASSVPAGSYELQVLPFGNGAERMLSNKNIGASIHGLDLNKHTPAHVFRSVQEGIACAMRYGLDIMRQNGLKPSVIRAGNANMFLSDVFTQSFVNLTGVPVELYNNDGSAGAALGAGMGAGIFKNKKEAFGGLKKIKAVVPAAKEKELYALLYGQWKEQLERQLKKDAVHKQLEKSF
jgi:xylulokinase